MNEKKEVTFNKISNDVKEATFKNNGAVVDVITGWETDQYGNRREVEVGRRIYYPDGTVTEKLYQDGEFNKAEGLNGEHVHLERYDTKTDIEYSYGDNGQMQLSSDDKSMTLFKNGQLMQSSQYDPVVSTMPVKPALVRNQSLGDYVNSGKKLDDDAIVVTYTTTKGVNGEEVLDKYAINSSQRNAVFEHNGFSDPKLQTILDHNNNETITWNNASGMMKPESDSNNIVFQKVGSDGELMNQYGSLKNSILGTSSDTTNTVRTIQARFSGSQDQIKARVQAAGGNISYVNNNGVVTATIVDKDGMEQTGTYSDGLGITGVTTNPNGVLKNLKGDTLNTSNWTQEQKDTWATYYDAEKNGASSAEIEQARNAVIESGTVLRDKNGNVLSSSNSSASTNNTVSTASSTDPNGTLKNLKGDTLNTSNWTQEQKNTWATYYDAKKNGASASEVASAQKAVLESGTKLYRNGNELTIDKSGNIVEKKS